MTQNDAWSSNVDRTAQLVQAAVAAWRLHPSRFAATLDALAERMPAAMPLVQAGLDAGLQRLWASGWGPLDLVHVVGRELTADHAGVVAAAVVADARRRSEAGGRLDPRWSAQLESLEERAASTARPTEVVLRRSVEVLALTARLPSIAPTLPPPGGRSDGGAGVSDVDPKILARVRALLAKAESTDFEEEAEAFTAKAQELLARYSLDEASLHTVADVGEPSVRRILLDDPYAAAKAYLVAAVAGANRCRTVYTADLGWVTVFGYDRDLDAVELLAASLLAQATGAMARHGPRVDAAGRSRTRAFRRAFLLGFAQRVGERLRRAAEAQAAEAGGEEGRLVPVLAARDDRVRAAERAAFPTIVRRAVSVSDGTGWSAGQAAAELASLGLPAGHLPRPERR
jgi:hypothetical protein